MKALLALYLMSHIILGNLPQSYWYIQGRDTLFAPLRALGLFQSWGFYAGNLGSTNLLRLVFLSNEGETYIHPLESARSPRPWRAVIGNSEYEILSNEPLRAAFLRYHCNYPSSPFPPTTVSLEFADAPFLKLKHWRQDPPRITPFRKAAELTCKD